MNVLEKTATAVLRKTNLYNIDFGNREFVGVWNKKLGKSSASCTNLKTPLRYRFAGLEPEPLNYPQVCLSALKQSTYP